MKNENLKGKFPISKSPIFCKCIKVDQSSLPKRVKLGSRGWKLAMSPVHLSAEGLESHGGKFEQLPHNPWINDACCPLGSAEVSGCGVQKRFLGRWPHTQLLLCGRGFFCHENVRLGRDILWAEKKPLLHPGKTIFSPNFSGYQKSTCFSCVIPWIHKIVIGSQKDCIAGGSFVTTN